MSIEKTIAKLYSLKRKPKQILKFDGKTKEKKESYIADFRHEGRRYQIYSGSLPDFYQKIDDAISWLQEGTIKVSQKKKISIEEAFDLFLTEYRLPKLQEYPEDKRVYLYRMTMIELNDFLKTVRKLKPLQYLHDVTEDIVRLFINTKAAAGIKNSSINRKMATMSSFYSFLTEREIYEMNPINFKKFSLKEPPPMTNYLTQEQIDKLLECCPEYLRNIVQFLIYTGFRKQNALDLKWENIDFERKIITVKVKQNKTHTVPIISKLYELLSELKKKSQSEYVFTYKGVRIKDAKKSFTTSLRLAEIQLPEGQLFHVLRHTAATILINNGIDISIVQQVLGHSSPRMTQKYAHLSTKKVLDDMERVFGK